MNRISSYCIAVCLYLMLQVSSLYAKDPQTMLSFLNDPAIEQQVLGMTNIFELKYNDEVKKLIVDYTTFGKRNSEAILNRSNYYFPIIEKIIEENNLPEELKYLSVVESGLRPTVKSKAGAVGLWQFMSSTAKMYDLHIASTNDERKDVAKSTQAALLYLTDLYKRYDDWALALAAYNCGPGNVNKAISRSGGEMDYWKIRKYLPKETRRYIPKMIATMYVMHYFADLGLEMVSRDFTEYSSFGIAYIYDKTSFSDIAELSGFNIDEIKKHNPSYTHSYIPASKKGNSLILPEAFLLSYLHNTQQMEQLKHVFYLKDALFNLEDQITLMPEVAAAESTRIVSAEPILHLSIDTPLVITKPKSSNLTVKPNVLVWNMNTNLIRLEKRQSLKDLQALKNLDANAVKFASNEGVIIY